MIKNCPVGYRGRLAELAENLSPAQEIVVHFDCSGSDYWESGRVPDNRDVLSYLDGLSQRGYSIVDIATRNGVPDEDAIQTDLARIGIGNRVMLTYVNSFNCAHRLAGRRFVYGDLIEENRIVLDRDFEGYKEGDVIPLEDLMTAGRYHLVHVDTRETSIIRDAKEMAGESTGGKRQAMIFVYGPHETVEAAVMSALGSPVEGIRVVQSFDGLAKDVEIADLYELTEVGGRPLQKVTLR